MSQQQYVLNISQQFVEIVKMVGAINRNLTEIEEIKRLQRHDASWQNLLELKRAETARLTMRIASQGYTLVTGQGQMRLVLLMERDLDPMPEDHMTYSIRYEKDFPDQKLGYVTGQKQWVVRATGTSNRVNYVDACIGEFATQEEAQAFVDLQQAPPKRWQTDITHLLDDEE